MLFKKSGREVKASISAILDTEQAAYREAAARFQKERSKDDLHLMNEIERRIERFERILRHVYEDQDYQLTEQDLIDFGF